MPKKKPNRDFVSKQWNKVPPEAKEKLIKSFKTKSPNREPKITAEILHCLMVVKNKHPEYRLMQILGNVYGNIDPYWIEDEDLLKQLETFYGQELRRK